MRRSLTKVLIPAVAALLPGFVTGAPAAEKKFEHPLYVEQLHRATRLMHAMRIEQAGQLIDEWIAANPGRPAGYFFRSSCLSWQLFLQPRDADTDELAARFEEATRQAARVAREAVDDPALNFEGALFMGAINGQEALLALIEHKYLHMAPLAKKAWNSLEKALEIDPRYFDSYFGKGMYQYFTDVLPPAFRMLAVAYGFEGDRERGLSNMMLAWERGIYSSDAAGIMLMNIYSIDEEPDTLVLEMAREMHGKYPDNPLVHWRYGDILLRLDRHGEAARVFREVEQRIEEGYPYYDNRMFTEFSIAFRIGVCQRKSGRSASALERFDSILARARAGERIRPEWIEASSWLEKGRIHFRLRQDTEARLALERVLELDDVRDSHDKARELLESIERRSTR